MDCCKLESQTIQNVILFCHPPESFCVDIRMVRRFNSTIAFVLLGLILLDRSILKLFQWRRKRNLVYNFGNPLIYRLPYNHSVAEIILII